MEFWEYVWLLVQTFWTWILQIGKLGLILYGCAILIAIPTLVFLLFADMEDSQE